MATESVFSNMDVIVAFIEGLASFFSTCVIPLLPIYLGYLSGNLEAEETSKKRTLSFTLCFIVGIFVALMLLNLSLSWIANFFQDSSVWFMRIGGILIVLLGIIQLGLFKIPFFQKTFHLNVNMKDKRMNPVLAFVMGFTFSFSWTPCIGPALASILVMAQTSGGFITSMGLVFVYACGFALPFLLISFGARKVTSFFQKHMYALVVITKIGAILLILMGSLMFFGKLSYLGGGTSTPGTSASIEDKAEEDIISFTLQNQSGDEVSLSDYKGKVVFLNFWATWCGVCKSELDDVKQLYELYKDSDEVAILTIVAPSYGQEKNADEIKTFIDENEIAFPVLFDNESEIFNKFQIRSFPTLYMLNPDQTVYGYASGGITLEMMQEIINKTLQGEDPSNNES